MRCFSRAASQLRGPSCGRAHHGPNENELRPAAVIPVLNLGLLKFDKETNLSVNAEKVNPRPQPPSKLKKAPN
jgi:hypothetical protein